MIKSVSWRQVGLWSNEKSGGRWHRAEVRGSLVSLGNTAHQLFVFMVLREILRLADVRACNDPRNVCWASSWLKVLCIGNAKNDEDISFCLHGVYNQVMHSTNVCSGSSLPVSALHAGDNSKWHKLGSGPRELMVKEKRQARHLTNSISGQTVLKVVAEKETKILGTEMRLWVFLPVRIIETSWHHYGL